ncbi:inositol monophosphatase family protein [Virgisporangium aurantiacum]|uniref:inositol monophosphatase family protein n=1 Tax=Virgisporangium aurantiacum TaxID=175570 RepID=UPI001950DA5B|nr:inositol monophosphatase [Virgisporangium aurantiacum]
MSSDLSFALDFADRAGSTVRDLVAGGFDVDVKADATPITTVDRVLNDRFVAEVRDRFPGDAVIGEEASHAAAGDRTWVIDPIDGTRQLILGIPVFMVSIALVVDGRPVVAVAHNPSTRETYRATLRGGAFRDGTRLAVSDRDGTVDAPATVGGAGAVPVAGGLHGDGLVRITTDGDLVPYRYPWPSVFSGCKVAEGAWDAVLDGSRSPWDVAAIALLVAEAGGTVTDRAGADQRYDGPVNGCLLSNGLIHDHLTTEWGRPNRTPPPG